MDDRNRGQAYYKGLILKKKISCHSSEVGGGCKNYIIKIKERSEHFDNR